MVSPLSLRSARAAATTAALACAVIAAGCVGPSNTGTGAYTGTDSTGGGAQDSAGGGGSAGQGDPSKNSASIETKDPSGASQKVDATGQPKEADAKVFGASNAGTMLQFYITDGKGTTLVGTIDTAAHPLPKKGIAVGDETSSAWVTLTNAQGVYISKVGGTIDISGCPTKGGEVVVGAFQGVVVENKAPLGGAAATLTLTGPFNLVYWGGAGAISCTPPAVDPGPDTTGGGGGNMGAFGKPAGATCAANPCDGGGNTSRNCCPYVPCMEPCLMKCTGEVETCSVACGADMGCAMGCIEKMSTCWTGCLTSCNVNATCKSAMDTLMQCESQASQSCDTGTEEGDDKCTFDACCKEWTAAF